MYLCKNCNKPIRWTEMMGWVHGANGEGYVQACGFDAFETTATPKPEDIEWFTK